MFEILHKINSNKLFGYGRNNREEYNNFHNWLNKQFFLNIKKEKTEDREHYTEVMEYLGNWGKNFKKNCPKPLVNSLFYIRRQTDSIFYQNYIGEASLRFTWPLFFNKFPLGNIWLVKISEEWDRIISNGEKNFIKQRNYKKKDPFFYPLDALGFRAYNFPYIVLNVLNYGIYPLIMFDYVTTSSNLIFVYIPDRNFSYSQIFEGGTTYQNILLDLQFYFGDQWAVDMLAPKKRGVKKVFLNPINHVEYFEWFVDKVNNRLTDLCNIQDPEKREIIGMTINRLILDFQLCIMNEIPYISKTFFFGCLDKIANLMTSLNIEKNETDAFKKLISVEFLEKEVKNIIKSVPNNAGTYLNEILEDSIEIIKSDNLNPNYIRALRNSYHGFNLKSKNFEILIQRDGEIHNDFPLVITPIIFYVLSIDWKI